MSVVLGSENSSHTHEFVALATNLAVEMLCFTIAIPSIDDPTYVPIPTEIPDVVREIHSLCISAHQRHTFVFSLPWCLLNGELIEDLIATESILFNCPVPEGKALVIKENGALGLCTHTTSFELLDPVATREVMATPETFLSFWNSEELRGLRCAVDVRRHPHCINCCYRDTCRGGCPLWWNFFDFSDIITKKGGSFNEAEQARLG